MKPNRGDKLICLNCIKTFYWSYPDFQWYIRDNCPYCNSWNYKNVSLEKRRKKVIRKVKAK